jgi:exonuclease VII small subunit
MKSKNIPPDIKSKSIKDAQNEIKEIIKNLENSDTNLRNSIEQYNRMIQLNYHIQAKFSEKAKEINQSNAQLNNKNVKKKLK